MSVGLQQITLLTAFSYLRNKPTTAGNVARSGLRGMANAVDSFAETDIANKGLDYIESGAKGLGAAYYNLNKNGSLREAMRVGTNMRKKNTKYIKQG